MLLHVPRLDVLLPCDDLINHLHLLPNIRIRDMLVARRSRLNNILSHRSKPAPAHILLSHGGAIPFLQWKGFQQFSVRSVLLQHSVQLHRCLLALVFECRLAMPYLFLKAIKATVVILMP
jgi:hypothetical protein